ncbi:putative ABC transporter (ATP-binding protein syrD) [Bradyrhizobium sp. ORS 285]|uniref:cyclic peptide export ABC transporter n=1 Tax=Bradyrhizobium sp. ORS 285 TaxID=115808 RepID=UPI0002406272|nr:cyclic peptide export ABC transporter [Bradyrhizobium sp. ORS 285]CCD88933.1 putative ABC transporter (ATP-binding protein syrD) [Bradyrhizobium sp. ORS 285]SMX58030.1 putative ABC transporter (ATP-binding protein syrD) [Bradyrhizobium sp. ORS 285]
MQNKLVSFLLRLVPGPIAVASGCSIVAAATTVALFAYVFAHVRQQSPAALPDVISFAALASASIASRLAAARASVRVGCAVILRLRNTLITAILKTRYRQLEIIGSGRLKAVVSADVQTIATAAPILVNMVTNLAMVASLLVYMCWLSPTGAGVIVGAAMVGVPLYWAVVGRSTRLSYQAWMAWERLDKVLGGLIAGLKQLKLSTVRTSRYLSEDIDGRQTEFLRLREQATWAGAIAMNVGQAVFLLVIGILLFQHSSDARDVEFFFAAIYLIGPLDAAIGSFASLGHVNAVFRRIQDLGVVLASSAAVDPEAGESAAADVPWRQVSFEGVCYSYGETGPADAFAFGPVDLVLKRGEIVFIKGGNGSGKSTFARLLAGLYEPSSGAILLDGRPVDDRSRELYRQIFSCLFEDAHAFERIPGHETCEDRARGLLGEWSIDRKVMTEHARFLNTQDLSRGQKGRLLLVSALMEDRDIYIFDEWAADQDARSREQFYLSLLPALKRDGKLVIVLTHDESFDSVADRIVRFHDGRIAADMPAMTGQEGLSRAGVV